MPSILITGCSSGIGYETAKMLRQMGWQVFASCRRAEDAERLRREGFAYALQLDVDDGGSIQTAFDGILSQTGGRSARWKTFRAKPCANSLKPTFSARGSA